MTNPIKVGIIMPLGSQQGGAEALLSHFMRYRSEEFVFAFAFFQDGVLVEEARRLGYDTVVIRATHLSSLPNYFETVRALRRWIISSHLNLAFSWMAKAHIYVSPATLGLGTKSIWYQHGAPEGDVLDRLATLLPADAVLCCSKTSEAYQNRFFPRRHSLVCYPGITENGGIRLSSAEARTNLGLSHTGPLVGVVARLERWKGVHVFVEAAEDIFSKIPQAILFVVGGAHPADLAYQEELRTMIRHLSRADQFLLLGQKSMSETTQWQAAADLMVHPVTGVEAFGMAVPEAMGQRKVVVASNRGGPSEVIENGISGVLVESGNPQELAACIIGLLADPARRERMGEAAYERSREFTVSVFMSRLAEILRDLTSTEL